jgi:hypothetical protein
MKMTKVVRFNKFIELINQTVFSNPIDQNTLSYHAIKKIESECHRILNRRHGRKRRRGKRNRHVKLNVPIKKVNIDKMITGFKDMKLII